MSRDPFHCMKRVRGKRCYPSHKIKKIASWASMTDIVVLYPWKTRLLICKNHCPCWPENTGSKELLFSRDLMLDKLLSQKGSQVHQKVLSVLKSSQPSDSNMNQAEEAVLADAANQDSKFWIQAKGCPNPVYARGGQFQRVTKGGY